MEPLVTSELVVAWDLLLYIIKASNDVNIPNNTTTSWSNYKITNETKSKNEETTTNNQQVFEPLVASKLVVAWDLLRY